MMLHTKYQGSRPCDFRQEDFFMFSYLAYVDYVTPWGRAIFGPRGHNLVNLIVVHEVMLHTKYQGSRPCILDKKIFSCFPYISLSLTCDPQGKPFFGPSGKIRTKLAVDH